MNLHIDAKPDENGWYDIKWAKAGPAIVFDQWVGVITDAYLHECNIGSGLFNGKATATYGFDRKTAYKVTHFMPIPKPPVNSK